jgi:hypothetical protein
MLGQSFTSYMTALLFLCRDTSDSLEGVVRIYNTGSIVLTQRYLAAFSVNLNMRDYPFDSQTLSWDVRSTSYDNSIVKFLPAAGPSLAASSVLLQGISDTDWTFDKYRQAAYRIDSGIFANYDLLSISITATRISTMSSTFLILPICLICAGLCLEMFMDTAEISRIQTPLACITATMGFSFVVSDLCPPVSYNTRMHLMIFQTYIFSVVALICNGLIFYIEKCKQRLSASNGEMKTLLNDSQELATRIRERNLSLPGNRATSAIRDAAKKEIPELSDPIHAIHEATKQVQVQCGMEVKFDTLPTVSSASEQERVPQVPATVKYFHGAAFGSAVDSEATFSSALGWVGSAETPSSGQSEKNGVSRNGKEVFHNVRDLLAAPEVEIFKRLEWGGGPILMFFGTNEMTTGNIEGWNR